VHSPQKIKLLLIIDTLGRGGAEGQVYELVKHLEKSRYEPVVCALTNKEDYIEKIRKQGVRVVSIAASFSSVPWNVHKLVSLIRLEQFHIVQNMMFTAGIFGTIMAKLLHVPVIINSVRSLGFTRRRHRRIIKRLIYKISDSVVVNSNKTQTLLASHRIVDIERFRPNSASSDLLSKRNELSLPAKASPVIGIVANLSPVKNHRCLLRAAPIILREFPNAVFLIVGDGPLKEDLERLAANLNIKQHVFFLGLREDTPELLRVMDLSVLCSFREGFSNAILESMASGTPVIASDVGGNSEALIDGVTGLLFDPYDHAELAKKVIHVLQNAELLRRMAIASRKRAEDRFAIGKMLQAYDNLYESLVIRKPRRRSLVTATSVLERGSPP